MSQVKESVNTLGDYRLLCHYFTQYIRPGYKLDTLLTFFYYELLAVVKP